MSILASPFILGKNNEENPTLISKIAKYTNTGRCIALNLNSLWYKIELTRLSAISNEAIMPNTPVVTKGIA